MNRCKSDILPTICKKQKHNHIDNIAFKLNDKTYRIDKIEALKMLQYQWRITQTIFRNMNKLQEKNKLIDINYWNLGNLCFTYKTKLIDLLVGNTKIKNIDLNLFKFSVPYQFRIIFSNQHQYILYSFDLVMGEVFDWIDSMCVDIASNPNFSPEISYIILRCIRHHSDINELFINSALEIKYTNLSSNIFFESETKPTITYISCIRI
jgi:hypothetical protein